MISSKNNKTSYGSKHIEIKYLVVRDWVKNGDFLIKYISTKIMLADSPTKAVAPSVFQHVKNTIVLSSFDVID